MKFCVCKLSEICRSQLGQRKAYNLCIKGPINNRTLHQNCALLWGISLDSITGSVEQTAVIKVGMFCSIVIVNRLKRSKLQVTGYLSHSFTSRVTNSDFDLHTLLGQKYRMCRLNGLWNLPSIRSPMSFSSTGVFSCCRLFKIEHT